MVSGADTTEALTEDSETEMSVFWQNVSCKMHSANLEHYVLMSLD
jgi:hypothetical protein